MLPTIRVLFCVLMATTLSLCVALADDDKPAVPVRVLIVSGVDYPGHPWRQVVAEIETILGSDPQFDVRRCDDMEVLGTEMIFDYDVLICNFKNYTPLRRETKARENLARWCDGGGGLMHFHFTIGAFQDLPQYQWREFESFIGRVWNPSFRGHDPHQVFRVRIADTQHPITAGVTDFDTLDELYTCLDGTTPIHVLATATSSVDEKEYPIAYTLTRGVGRIFYTALGHDARAFAPESLRAMLRNAAIWCSKRDDTTDDTTTQNHVVATRSQEIAASLGDGAKLVAYLDCGGIERFDDGVRITADASARSYTFGKDAKLDDVPASHSTVLFASPSVAFNLDGLDRAKKYRIQFVCWDYDANGRSQSFVVKSADGTQVKIIQPTISLPDFKESGLPPRLFSLALPMAFVRDGKLVVSVDQDGGPNAVVSEIWITEML
ncbi:MAG: ThuA domain-containing protein [Thermoguttaceae bacterium]